MSDEPEEYNLQLAISELQATLSRDEMGLGFGMPPVDVGKLSDASKERIKLRSQYANGMAISLFAVGVLGPIVAVMGNDITASRLVGLVLTAIICFGLSVVLHLYAAKNLGELDQ